MLSARPSRLGFVLVLLTVFAVSSLGAAGAWAQETPAPQRDRPDSLTLMTYNVLYATPDTGTIRAIDAADPDIVALQEISEPRLRHIADALDYYFHHSDEHEANEEDTGLLSRYPISRPTRYGAVLYLTVDDPVHIANVHLSPYPYEPYALRDEEMTPEEAVAQAEETRAPEIRPVLDALTESMQADVPTFLMGDFNEPSHLDWTPAAAEAGLHLGVEAPWPTSRMVSQRGFRDAFRVVHPDEVEHPGYTWTTLTGDSDEVHDRIDFIYVAGEAATVDTTYTVGLRETSPTDLSVPGYPSDHRGVVTTVSLDASSDQ
ncbi:endonuclease/exonuclease/phosphatase family protein [Salinibacter altiplanensis]|uniref:endonuclease/exonuclease/phosphatase family protein n=1 Tax=Salinibacter altiplanensis TaxID=1803181 RepID=UPI001E5C27FD|nr:endonuclease/exonuclease/phosphatase family protein [Salinibacter altiplanensis]